jgi:hypothetical protein
MLTLDLLHCSKFSFDQINYKGPEPIEADVSPPSRGIVVRNCSLVFIYLGEGEGGGSGGGGGGREDVALLQPLSTSSQGSVLYL